MKNLLFLFVLLAGFAVSSCSDDDSSEPSTFVKATLDGETFDADVITAVGDDSLGELLAFITGKENNTGYIIGLNIPASVELDLTNEVDASDFGITFTDPDENAFFTVGSVTITKFEESSKTVQGTFDFTATNDSDDTDVHTITDGSFRINYTQ